MKVYILTDMEGITGVVHPDQLSIEGKEYNRARKLFTGDVNAAIEGAVQAGAKEIVVCEGHGSMRNILIEDLHEKASLILGPAEYKSYCQIIDLDDSFDAAVFVGFHAKAGTEKAILSHTWVGSAIHHFKINGDVLGETGIDAAICGEFGVPVVCVTGDDALAKEAKETLGQQVNTVVVKKAIARTIAKCYPPSASSKMITSTVKNSLQDISKYPIYKVKLPVTIEIGFYMNQMAYKASQLDGVERITDRDVLIKGDNFIPTITKAWQAIAQSLLKTPEWMA